MSETTTPVLPVLTPKDFATDQEVRWCPGCGDYSILAQVQKVMPGLGIPRENIVIVSGIGCSTPVNRVHTICIHIIRKPAAAANTRYNHNIFFGNANARHNLLHLRQYGIIAATGAPAYFLVGGKIFRGKNGQYRGRCFTHFK